MNQSFKQNCKYHSNLEVEYMHINSENSQILKCNLCELKEKINPKDLVLIEDCIPEIQQSNNEEAKDVFIKNWPPGVNTILLDIINNNLKEIKKDKIEQEILEYFEQLEKELNESLQVTKKSILLQIDSLNFDCNWIKEAYNQISQKNELSTIFAQNKDNSEELNSQLSQLILKIKDKSEDNKNKISDLYKEFVSRDYQIDFQQPNLIKRLIIELFQNIRFNKGLQVDKDNINNKEISQNNPKKSEISCQPVINFLNELYNNFKKEKQSLENKVIERDEEIFRLNDGIDQFMTQSFKEKQFLSGVTIIEGLYKNLDQWLINYNIEYNNVDDIINHLNIIQDYTINTSVSMLNIQKEQIQNLGLLINQMEYKNKNCNYKNYTIEYFKNLLSADKLFVQEDLSFIFKTLEMFPIFDIKPLKQFKPIQDKFYESDEKGSRNFYYLNKKIIDQNQKQTLLSSNSNGDYFRSNILDNSKKYIIRFKLSQSFKDMNNIQISLQNFTSKKYYFLGNSSKKGLDRTKGLPVNEIQNIYELEMRICINDNYLIYTDFPNYENIFVKRSADPKFKINDQYYIQIMLSGMQEKFIQITNIYEVEEFPQF